MKLKMFELRAQRGCGEDSRDAALRVISTLARVEPRTPVPTIARASGRSSCSTGQRAWNERSETSARDRLRRDAGRGIDHENTIRLVNVAVGVGLGGDHRPILHDRRFADYRGRRRSHRCGHFVVERLLALGDRRRDDLVVERLRCGRYSTSNHCRRRHDTPRYGSRRHDLPARGARQHRPCRADCLCRHCLCRLRHDGCSRNRDQGWSRDYGLRVRCRRGGRRERETDCGRGKAEISWPTPCAKRSGRMARATMPTPLRNGRSGPPAIAEN